MKLLCCLRHFVLTRRPPKSSSEQSKAERARQRERVLARVCVGRARVEPVCRACLHSTRKRARPITWARTHTLAHAHSRPHSSVVQQQQQKQQRERGPHSCAVCTQMRTKNRNKIKQQQQCANMASGIYFSCLSLSLAPCECVRVCVCLLLLLLSIVYCLASSGKPCSTYGTRQFPQLQWQRALSLPHTHTRTPVHTVMLRQVHAPIKWKQLLWLQNDLEKVKRPQGFRLRFLLLLLPCGMGHANRCSCCRFRKFPS